MYAQSDVSTSEAFVTWAGLIVSLISTVLAVLAFLGVQQVKLSRRHADARRVLAAWGPLGPGGVTGVKVINSSGTDFRGLVTVACASPPGSVTRLGGEVLFAGNQPWTYESAAVHRLIDEAAQREPGTTSRPADHDGDMHRVRVTYGNGGQWWVRREDTVERLDKLVIWAERTRAETISAFLGRRSPFLRRTRIRVKVVEFPRTEALERAVRQLAADGGTPDGADLPDIVAGPHDWVGGVATGRWVEPLPLDPHEKPRFHPASVAALCHRGKLLAAPYVFDSVALIRNDSLAGGPMPTTLAEVVADGRRVVAQRRIAGGLPLALQVGPPNEFGEAGDPYHLWPVFASVGGSFFGLRRPDTDRTAGRVRDAFDDVAEWKDDFVAAFAELATLGHGQGGSGALDPSVGRDEAIQAFLDRRAPYLVCSSRALRRIGERLEVTVAPVPPLGSRPATPLVSVYGFFVYRHAPNLAAATDVLYEYLADPAAGMDLQRFQPLVPTQRAAMGRVADANPRLAAYVSQVRGGMLMPSWPETRAAWNLLGTAQYRVLAGEGDPRTVAAETADAGWDLLRTTREVSPQ
jgi:arabinogalactan oligomer/maltooligosaccharide transport system substrate-binding protein